MDPQVSELNDTLRKIILGLQGATSKGGNEDWVLGDLSKKATLTYLNSDSTKNELVSQARAEISAFKLNPDDVDVPDGTIASTSSAPPRRVKVDVKECWTPETRRANGNSSPEDSGSSSTGVLKNQSAISRALASKLPHSTLSMLTWPQKRLQGGADGSVRIGGDIDVFGPRKEELFDYGHKAHLIPPTKSCASLRECLPSPKTCGIFLAGFITGVLVVICSSMIAMEVDDGDDIGGNRMPVPAGLIDQKNISGFPGHSGQNPTMNSSGTTIRPITVTTSQTVTEKAAIDEQKKNDIHAPIPTYSTDQNPATEKPGTYGSTVGRTHTPSATNITFTSAPNVRAPKNLDLGGSAGLGLSSTLPPTGTDRSINIQHQPGVPINNYQTTMNTVSDPPNSAATASPHEVPSQTPHMIEASTFTPLDTSTLGAQSQLRGTDDKVKITTHTPSTSGIQTEQNTDDTETTKISNPETKDELGETEITKRPTSSPETLETKYGSEEPRVTKTPDTAPTIINQLESESTKNTEGKVLSTPANDIRWQETTPVQRDTGEGKTEFISNPASTTFDGKSDPITTPSTPTKSFIKTSVPSTQNQVHTGGKKSARDISSPEEERDAAVPTEAATVLETTTKVVYPTGSSGRRKKRKNWFQKLIEVVVEYVNKINPLKSGR